MKTQKQLRIQRGHDSPDWQWALIGVVLAVLFISLIYGGFYG